MGSSTELRDAIYSGDVEEVQKCLDNGAKLDQPIDGVPPLTFAIRNGEEDIAIFLIENGADISLETPLEDKKDTKNEPLINPSPLQVAWRSSITDFILSLIHEWSQEVALDGLWLSILRLTIRPALQTPYLMAILTSTLFGFHMRSLAVNILEAIWKNKVSQLSLRPIPTYFAMLFLARRYAIIDTNRLNSDWDLWRAVKLSYQAPLWRLEGFMIMFVQEILWSLVMARYSLVRVKDSKAPLNGGDSAIEAIISYDGSCERVAYSLLEHGLFSADYVRESLWEHPRYSNRIPYWESERSHLRRFWTWSLDRGNEQIIAKLLELGVPASEPSRRGHPLEHAVSLGHESVANMFLQKGREKNDYVSSDIHQALIASARTLNKLSGAETNPESEDRLFYTLLECAQHVNSSDESTATALTYAVAKGNAPAVKALIEKGANVNKTDRNGKTPLLGLQPDDTAAPILELLLEAGANINHQDDEGYTILLWHARLSNTKVVRLLLDNGADPKRSLHDGQTAMQLAARYCMTKMMQDLLNAGASVDDASASTSSPLILASHCHYERAEALRLLLANGADPNVVDHKGKTPLHLVCYQPSSGRNSDGTDDQFESIKALIDAGVDVSRPFKGIDYDKVEREVTALGIVATRISGRSKYRSLKLLLDAGASPNTYASDVGEMVYKTAIVSACQEGPHAESIGQDNKDEQNCVELLLNYGADLHYQDNNGMTLWHHVADGDNFLAAQTLIERELEVDSHDIHGRTALHISCRNRYWMTTEKYMKWQDAGMYSGSQEYADWHCSIESSITMLGIFAAGAMATAQDKHGCTPLHIAAKAGNPRILSMLLLYAGGNQVYDYPDIWGRLPFHHAANSAEATRVLLHWHLYHQVDSDRYYQVHPPPQTINSLANEFGGKIWDEVLKRRYQEAHPDEIIDDNAPVPPWRRQMINARDKLGNTPLHYAGLVGNLEVVRQYLELSDIDLSIVNKDGDTALDLSRANRECALAIIEKFSEMGMKVPVDENVREDLISQHRRAAQTFVDGLREEYRYGVYSL
ncbi:ankyrin repeat-containing domain protein [Biscogniauxia marginata]|nr:ankyrin repeat-containing domain protein [Biscogniauxia marginata]